MNVKYPYNKPVALCSTTMNSTSFPQQPTSTRKSEPHHQRQPERPIPTPPNSFYQTVKSASKSGVRLTGITALPGLGADPSAVKRTRDERPKGITGGPDVSPKSWRTVSTLDQAAKVIAGPSAPLINRSVVDSDEKFLEQVFMESTVSEMEQHLSQPISSAPSVRKFRDFVRNPVPWVKQKLGYENEEATGFYEQPYYLQTSPGMNPKWQSASFYHGDQSIDVRRRSRLQRQATDESRALLIEPIDKSLYKPMNSSRTGRSSTVLRDAAAAASVDTQSSINELHERVNLIEAKSDEKENCRHLVTTSCVTSTGASKENDPKRHSIQSTIEPINESLNLWKYFGFASVLLGLSFSALFIQRRFDFSGGANSSPTEVQNCS